ncbi:MAG: 3-phosphoshikimate 1-carboxyvinyltransferase [Lachnospiraceae bacterium]|jgi:3-phosphoshikimate 1-carboxyvinyltransferase|nr:3-phosphoshikimate 1-carboxyvinyltransferase [Lachnospiraceae bacterium]
MKENYKVHMVSAPIDWTVTVPGSKSMTNRALLMGSLADGKTTLSGVLFSDDSRHFLAALQALGFDVEIQEAQKQVTITGLNGKVPVTEGKIDVGSAGTAARFLTALLGVAEGTFTIQASEQMKKRPMKPLFDVLVAIGAKISYLEKEGHLPIQITGIGGTKAMDEVCCVALDISESTQFLSALLLISPMIKQGLSIAITSARKDGSYIQITRKMMENFGVEVMFDGENYNIRKDSSYKAGAYQIEPDISAACYFYAAAALTGGKALVKNVTWDCMQGDLQFLNVLAQMGCTITETAQGIVVCGAEGGRLKGITVDMKEFSDQTMTLAAIAPFAEEDVRIENVGHIRLQESDRIHAIATELSRLGVTCKEEEDALTIQPKIPNAGIVQTYDDHRMAMAFALIGLRVQGIEIANPMCCRKTFEEYFDVLETLTRGK